MKNTMKKIFSLFLVVVMIVVSVPTAMAFQRTDESEAFLEAFAKFRLFMGYVVCNADGEINTVENIPEIYEVFINVWTEINGDAISNVHLDEKEKISEYTIVLLEAREKLDKYLISSDYTILFDPYKAYMEEFKFYVYQRYIPYDSEESTTFESNFPQEKLRESYIKLVSDTNKLGEKFSENPTSITQADFDEIAAEHIELWKNVNRCLFDNIHVLGVGIDLGDGTHMANCIYCNATDLIVPHTFGEYVSNSDATTQTDGTKTAKCEYCNATDTIVDVGSKLDHKYTSQITTAPTHIANGVKTFTCTCGDSYTEIIPKTPEHTYYISRVIAPTCESVGYTTYICACGDSYNDNYISEKGHSYSGQLCTSCGEKCSCNCHKKGIANFFWKIGNFFNKLFKIKSKQFCVCGIAHY